MADIQDFGKKIGGARKDVWRSRGLALHDINSMTDLERQTHIKKDNIWVRPDWEKIIESGTPQAVAFWQNKMRQAIPPKPPDQDEATQNNYVEVVGKIRDAVMSVQNPFDIDTFYRDFLYPEFVNQEKSRSYYVTIIPEASGIVTNKVLKAAQEKYRNLQREAQKKLFGIPKDQQVYVSTKQNLSIHKYDQDQVKLEAGDHDDRYKAMLTISSSFGRSFYYMHEDDPHSNVYDWQHNTYFVMDARKRKPIEINFDTEKDAQDFIETYAHNCQALANKQVDKPNEGSQKRKGPFVPPQLRHIKRTGPEYRNGRKADGKLFLDDLNFRGGEFGNWLNDHDRQTSLDMAYDALRDLARVLQIKPEDIALGNKLAIAFGARGRGGANAASAHYEPDRQVINLTKMSGAGCLAHEWGHALDHAIGIAGGAVGLATEEKKRKVPASFSALISALRYKQVQLPPGEITEEMKGKIEHCRRNLSNWISSVKPLNLPEDMSAAWDKTVQSIMDNAATFTGAEYQTWRGSGETLTKPEVEILSQISKAATRHSVPKNAKQQICLWARDLGRYQEQANSKEASLYKAKTDFYKGSIEFDKHYSRSAHGYWQSECEMFARAFDCYISDKIKETGLHSEYLTAYADSFVIKGEGGKPIAAIPQGEERKLLNEKFDLLIKDLKEIGILHDHIEELAPEKEERAVERHRSREHDEKSFPKNAHYEQMSFEEMLFSAEQRRTGIASKPGPSRSKTLE